MGGIITLRGKHSGAVYCNRSCLWRADDGRAGGRAGGRTDGRAGGAVSEPYYSQRARCLVGSLSDFFIALLCFFILSENYYYFIQQFCVYCEIFFLYWCV